MDGVENQILNVLEAHIHKASRLIIDEEVLDAQERIRERLSESVLSVTKDLSRYFDIKSSETTITLSVKINTLNEDLSKTFKTCKCGKK